ncbi:MAG: class I SAM-dependent methyltransferase [Candidatus Sumerlaeia bacterium]|nr:class I SAM-dependent methyltransferase [Candidatus Sumerlaeia bacterium]
MSSKLNDLQSGRLLSSVPSLTIPGARKIILSIFSRMTTGALRVELPDGRRVTYGTESIATPPLMRIHEERFFTRLIVGGSVALGEAYVDGDWDSPDLTAVLTVLAQNMTQVNDGELWTSLASRIGNRLRHLMNRNNLTGSRGNISYHYDIGNDFYQLMLDETMTYSSALYTSQEESLEQGQTNKIRALLDRVDAREGDHILEIGSGWGSLALEAARERGCRVTTITLSKEQLRVVRNRVRNAGLEGRIKPMLCDYRRMRGQFDKVVSVEMIEAVGHEYLGTYFRHVDRLLKPNGLVALQAITIPDQRYERYRRTPDWIQKYIFPGAVVPSVTALSTAMTKHSSLYMESMTNFPQDYARTLREWSHRFEANLRQVFALGYDEKFVRMWRYYLAYCEAGFAARVLGVVHMTLSRAGNGTLNTMGHSPK